MRFCMILSGSVNDVKSVSDFLDDDKYFKGFVYILLDYGSLF